MRFTSQRRVGSVESRGLAGGGTSSTPAGPGSAGRPPIGLADWLTDTPRLPPPPPVPRPASSLPPLLGLAGRRQTEAPLSPRPFPRPFFFPAPRLLPGSGSSCVGGPHSSEQREEAASRMKCKPNQTRTYDPEGFKKRAACLCFRSEREDEVLLVSSSRYPDRWIVPGGGMEPEEEPGGAAVREVYEEAGVKGKLGRLLGVFEQNQDRKHRTYVYVLTVTELLEDWEDSVSIGRKREWFKVEDAIKVLQCHKPVHAEYLEKLKLGGSPTNGNSMAPSSPDSDP
ncbi:diphosphoinositol polyphosphate phosphohydrolase 3-beta-like [Pongo pygmaeus]|nr:diphosphoinositol polyphosphate phosphohydrolase 3-beta-like [Pongo pygmaeus]